MKKIQISVRRTKIIATVGPSLLEGERLEEAISKVDALRINFSHADTAYAETVIRRINKCTGPQNNIALIADLKGPEIRSDHHTHTFKLKQKVMLVCTTPKQKNKPRKNFDPNQTVYLDHPHLHRLVQKKQCIRADDGALEFKVLSTSPQKIEVQVIMAGTLYPNKTINVPGINLELPILDQEDKTSLAYICTRRFNWVALSFVSSAKDVTLVRQWIAKRVSKKNKDIKIIAKIENQEAIKNLEAITKVADGIMVARGDLGENLPYEKIPILQAKIISLAQRHGKVIIIATQMLETMIRHPRPQRPEVTDVSTAAHARVDAVMLSAETASGKYPLQAIQAMDAIIRETETAWNAPDLYPYHSENIVFPIIKSGLELAYRTESKHLIAITTRGKSARLLSALRPSTISIVASYDQSVVEGAYLYYAVSPLYITRDINDVVELQLLLKTLNLKKNQSIVFIFGFPFKVTPTNTIRWIKTPK